MLQALIHRLQKPEVLADWLPIELWHAIFESACTDGGRTSLALSRVSRAFRSIATPYRYHSVRLSKLRDIEAFLAQYEAAGANPPPVRHLLLSFLPGETDMIVLEGAYHMRDFHSWREAKEEWNARCVDLLTRLFALVGARLETLTVLQSRDILLPFVRCTLPALRELTLLSEDRLFVRLPDEANRHGGWGEPGNLDFYAAGGPLDLAEVTANPPFPSLRRLHIVHPSGTALEPPKRVPVSAALPVWARLAPRLVVLRLSHVDTSAIRSIREIVRTEPREFSALRTLIVRPTPEAVEGVDKIREVFASAAPTDAPAEARVDFVQEPPATRGDTAAWARLLEKEWSERM